MMGTMFLSSILVAAHALAHQQTTTLKGCVCESECKTSLMLHCNAAEYCRVDRGACPEAEWFPKFGYYDWCVFEPNQTYESKSAAEKQQLLLDRVAENSTSVPFGRPLACLTTMLSASAQKTFDASSDVLPSRLKPIHTVGVVGGIRFSSTEDHLYQGLFEGVDHGLIRFSTGPEPNKVHGSFAAGMGIKLLRSGRPSANIVAMFSLEGQTCEGADWFLHDWSNHISPPAKTDKVTALSVARGIADSKFRQASYCTSMVGISDLASPAQGQAGEAGTFPWQLIFSPKVSSQCDWCGDYERCLQRMAATIPVGTDLFDVFALEAPGAGERLIGTITLTSALTSSKFGDEELFFRHQRMEDDFAINPQWLESIDTEKECGSTLASAEMPKIEDGCKSAIFPSMLEDDPDSNSVSALLRQFYSFFKDDVHTP